MRLLPGSPYPLGATFDGRGVNFAVFAEHATKMELCLFANGREERHLLPERSYDIWHGYVPLARPGLSYGFRAHGPYAPQHGQRYNPKKLLIDPYAKALSGPLVFHEALRGEVVHEHESLPDIRDTAPHVPKAVVTEGSFDWQGDKPPRIPWRDTVIYEAHVRGLTMAHPKVAMNERGRFLGVASKPVLEHLLTLGVTAIELLPVAAWMDEPHLAQKGRTNYWGYNPFAFFAPDGRLASGYGEVAVHEFKTMVRTLHQHGLEVILDVVFNHTAEADGAGPTVSLRGLDNLAYYHVDPNNPWRYRDYTGCGNSVNLAHPRSLQLVLDALRYWVREMHVDGFRFDLAPTLAREPHEFDARSRFFTTLAQDPTLAGTKLIAEPWDLGTYQLGHFPRGFCEWNDKYRDCVRRFWRGDGGQAADLAYRLTGSSDLFYARTPEASLNFITAHDGFTLRDLVSFRDKHNEANGENGQDGHSQNFSDNYGAEGETTDPSILSQRALQQRNFLATLFLSQGIPMLLAGDELGRTQKGNNNAYCQDNDISYLSWSLDEEARALLEFTRAALKVRREHPVLRRRRFFTGKPVRQGGAKDVTWYDAQGHELGPEAWHAPELRCFGMLIDASAADLEPERASTLLVYLNAAGAAQELALPTGEFRTLLATALPAAVRHTTRLTLPARSLVVLERVT